MSVFQTDANSLFLVQLRFGVLESTLMISHQCLSLKRFSISNVTLNLITVFPLSQVDKCGDTNDEGDEFKLPPLETAKHSGKPTSSKSSTESLRLKSPKYTIWDRSNVQSVLTDYGYNPMATPLLQRPDKLERQYTVNKVLI